MPKQGTWFRVDGLANWGDAFTYLRNLQWGTRSDPEAETALVLTDRPKMDFVNGLFNGALFSISS